MLRLVALAGLAMTTPMTALGSSPALAQNAGFYTATYIEVGPVLAKVGAGALSAYRKDARKDAVSLEVFQRIDRPNQFVVLASWTDQKAFEAHSSAEPAKKLNEKLATMLAAPTDTRTHNALSVAPAKTGQGSGRRHHPCGRSIRRRRTTAPTHSSNSPTAAAGTPAICSSTSGGKPTGRTISP